MAAGIRVLYVDDEPGLLEIARLFLEQDGEFSVTTALSACEALAFPGLRLQDVIVSDYQMPEMDGIGFLKEIRKRHADLPFILFTGRGREEVVIDAINNGADFYLQKGGHPNAQFAELAHKIRQAVRRRVVERELQLIFKNMINAFVVFESVFDENGRYVSFRFGQFNDAYARIAKVKREDVAGKDVFEVWPATEQSWVEAYGSVATTGIPRVFDMYHEPTKGWYHCNAYRPTDSPARVCVIFEDITERRRDEAELQAAYDKVTAAEEELRSQYDELAATEQQIRESEEKYRELVENAESIILRLDTAGNITFFNEYAQSFFQYTPDEIIGKPAVGTIVPATESGSGRDLQRMIDGIVSRPGDYAFNENENITREGKRVRVRWQNKPLLDRNGQFSGVLSIGTDITQRRKAEEALRESEEKYRSLVDLVPDAVLVHREGTVVYVNPECVRLTGAESPDDLIGRNMMPFIHPDDRAMALEHLRIMQERGVTIPLVEERIQRLDGRFLAVEITARPVLYQGLPSVIVVFRDISDRKKKEDELRAVYEQIAAAEEELRGQYEELARGERLVRETGEKFRNVIDNAPYGMHFYELKPGRGLVFTGANPGADRILGVGHDQFIGKTPEEAFPGLAGTGVPDRYREVVESGSVWRSEQVLYDRGSISGVYDVCAFRTAPGCLAAMFVDISSRKRTENLLRESEERSRKILEEVPLPLALVGNDGTLPFLNDRFVRVFGYTAEDIPTLEAWWERAYPDPDYRERVRLQWEEAVSRSREDHADIMPAEYRVTCKNGEERLIGISGIALGNGFLATFTDQTDRKRAEDALLRKTEELDRFFTASLDLFCIAGTDGYFRRLNPEWEKTLGYTLAEMEGHRFLDFVHPDDLPGTLAAVADLSEQKQVLNFTNRYRHRDGTYRWIEWRSFPSGDRIFASARDITGRKKMEEALRQANRKMNLLSGITRHDIKNQLMILSGYLEISGMSPGDPARTAEFIEKEKKIAAIISRQISFTGDYEDLGVKSPVWQNVSALVGKITNGLPLRDVRVGVADPLLEIYADPLCEKVFYNLIDNALRYGGRKMTAIRISSRRSGGDLVIVVEDNGAGIEADARERLFERGFGKNTGLGLFLSREILSITGITITETGGPGTGARFELRVPGGEWRNPGESPG